MRDLRHFAVGVFRVSRGSLTGKICAGLVVFVGLFIEALYPRLGAGLAGQRFFNGFLRGAGRPFDFTVLDAPAFAPGHRHQGALHRRRLGNVQLQEFPKVVLDATVVGAQGEQYLPQFLPTFVPVAGAEPLFGVGGWWNPYGADDVA